MDLLTYLCHHFFTRDQLIARSDLSETEFEHFRQMKVMPACSYSLEGPLLCRSFFGEHSFRARSEFYAKGYVSWLTRLPSFESPPEVKAWFKTRYRARLRQLELEGFSVNHPKLTTELETHLEREWSHFLDGTYGLCTRSGLPEDIASKEAAILIIEEWIKQEPNRDAEKETLRRAVDLLDEASAPFAHHERARSSRHRLVNEVRRIYSLESPPSRLDFSP
ncbi:DUF6058 domain-containing protein [Sulfidibacter corallicola]|uniref:Uncharacterized protein n=1 Tax=Sulfidibacter corallicola TaxID=2818388 RepID=A0A8A4TLM7_SULCO|nr:DUF6058 family natural product biosynthesis protein [Sulfidibacter corallicola]QTD50114.1 hypothetical protein J3U87_31405 [Sulfidibacter corallicola]